MNLRILLGVLIAATPIASAAAMPVSTFLAKAERLQKKGPLAMFSRDLKLVMNQIKADFAQIRAERLAAKGAGRPTAFCPPDAGVKLTDRDILVAMQAVPSAERATTSTKAALRAYLARRHPCPAKT